MGIITFHRVVERFNQIMRDKLLLPSKSLIKFCCYSDYHMKQNGWQSLKALFKKHTACYHLQA